MHALISILVFGILFSPQVQADVLFAHGSIETSEGSIKFRLNKKEAPNYVENFVGLATGRKQFLDAKTGEKVEGKKFYKNMIFHKVHPDLGIQTGCPWGTGKGWPGYTVPQEKNELKFDQPYLIGMALIEGKKNSVGSQFFITTKKAPHLDDDYTVIGKVTSGMEIVDKIARAPSDAMMRPIEPIKLEEVIIEEE